MVCIYCGHKTDVINTRAQKRTNGVWRRRQCQGCAAIFTTTELPDLSASLRVSTSSSTKLQVFSEPKLFASIYECLKHLPNQAESAHELTNTVIKELLNTNNAVLQQSEIARATHKVLQNFNKLAADQYAAYHKLP